MANKLPTASNNTLHRAKDNILLLLTTHNNRGAIKINTLLSQTTEGPLLHTPQLHINKLPTLNKVLPTSRAKRHTSHLLLNLRTEPRKHIQTSLHTARTEMATNKKAYQVLMERRVSEQHL